MCDNQFQSDLTDHMADAADVQTRIDRLVDLIDALDGDLSDARTTLDAIREDLDVDAPESDEVDRAAHLLAAVGDRLQDLGASIREDATAM